MVPLLIVPLKWSLSSINVNIICSVHLSIHVHIPSFKSIYWTFFFYYYLMFFLLYRPTSQSFKSVHSLLQNSEQNIPSQSSSHLKAYSKKLYCLSKTFMNCIFIYFFMSVTIYPLILLFLFAECWVGICLGSQLLPIFSWEV